MKSMLKSILQKIPLIGQYYQIEELTAKYGPKAIRTQQELFLQQLRREARYADPRHLIHFEHQTYSQNGEDGIVEEILRRIGVRNRTFLEIGTGSGLQCNTAMRLAQGWSGWWVEGNPRAPRKMRRHFANALDSGQLQVINALVTAENIGALLAEHGVPDEVDLFSLDVDRNTYWIWNALTQFRPRAIVIEYNASYPAGVDWKVEYDAAKWWNGTHYYGASLKALELLGKSFGYSLVGCESTGVNCFFVRDDLVGDRFLGPFNSETHFEPPRYFLTRLEGHPRGFAD
jgi:hypothetical protein